MKYLPGDYISGFVDGEGCFCISISKHKTSKTGFNARLIFEIELRADDREILESIGKTLDCGRIYDLNYDRYGWYPHVKLAITKIADIKEKVIPFFEKYPLRAKKRKTFIVFCKAIRIFDEKRHLTHEGLLELKKLRKEMRRYSARTSFR